MFSHQDVHDIYRSFSAEQSVQVPQLNLPPLLPSVTGQGFTVTEHALRELNERISNGSERISVDTLCNDLDIETDALLQFARMSPALVLLSVDGLSLITKKERDALAQLLSGLTSRQVVSKASFSHENDVSMEGVESLVRADDIADSLQNDLAIEGYLASKLYRETLSAAIRKNLEGCMQESKTAEISSQLLPGSPPLWYISAILDGLEDLSPHFHISKDDKVIRCVPKSSVLQRRDATLHQLQAGDIPCLDTHKLAKDFLEVYPSIKDVQDHLDLIPNVRVSHGTAISENWLSKYGQEYAHTLQLVGYVDLTRDVELNFPSECRDEVLTSLKQHTIDAYNQHADNTCPAQAGSFLLTRSRYDSERDVLVHAAKAQATHQWQQLHHDPEREIKFQLQDTVAFIPDNQPVLRAVSETKDVEKAAGEQFSNEIASLESGNEKEFAAFWTERVNVRIQIYNDGLSTIGDEKLREQLSELLSTYLIKDLCPDAISKARSQGFVRSRKTKKNIQKLESTLRAETKGSSTLKKFDKKQDLPEVDATTAQEVKKILVGDMVRKMQKQSDGPLLFITLLIVLLARNGPGIVYATGKFAPKLLKQLKSVLNQEEYEKLEKWKDLAKAGSLTAEDKDAMKHLAAGV